MELMEIIKKRYSTKHFDPTKPLTAEQLSLIENLLRYSPSSTNIQPWHFIIASTEEGKKRIAKGAQGFYSFNEERILNAGAVVLFTAKHYITDEHLQKVVNKEDADGRFKSAELKAQSNAARTIFTNLHKYEFKDIQHWTAKQVYLNVGFFLFGVAQMGLDALPIEGVSFKALDEEFNLWDRGLIATAVVSVGHGKEDDFNKHLPKSRLELSDILERI